MLQNENTNPNSPPIKSALTKPLITLIPPIRDASSPDVNRRKNFVGSVSNRPHNAASVAMFIRVVIRITAIVRTIPSDAVVKLVTMITCVTVAKPCLSSIGIMSANIVSVTSGMTSGISPLA